jgi:UDP-2,4-diacetamido-2,4,6-trideoxy-beta-L-altropyranose hydrolase
VGGAGRVLATVAGGRVEGQGVRGKPTMTLSPLLIRADASAQIGTGHIMRCLALAQAWQAQGGAVTFASLKTLPAALQTRLQNEQIALHLLDTEPGSEDDARQTAALAASLGAAAVVVDGYHFGGHYQYILKESLYANRTDSPRPEGEAGRVLATVAGGREEGLGVRVLFIDDNAHADHYYADFVLNQNIYAEESMYKNREPYTILLLGTRYILLRREFWRWRDNVGRVPHIVNNLLVTMGGSDPENVTAKVLDALELIDTAGLEIVVIVGSSNPHLPDLQRRVGQSRHKMKFKQNVQSMPALMIWADAAISAAGTTTWELAFMGVPMALIAVAENQRQIMQEMSGLQVALPLGWHADATLESIAEAVQELLLSVPEGVRSLAVDGFGVERVVHRLLYPPLRFRRVKSEDCRIIWEWANDPITRAASFSSEPIAWETHVEWFYRKLDDRFCVFLIAEAVDGTPVGQVRYDRDKNKWIISVSVAPEFRGLGYGTAIIALSLDEFQYRHFAVHAYIKPDNLASIRAFEKAGFVDQGMATVKDSPAIHYVYSRFPSP